MNPDRPVAGLKEDGFNYYPLARQLAPHLLLSSGDPSLVAGIEAPWGSGKTSFLNLTKLALNSLERAVLIFDYCPWVYSTVDALIVGFCVQIAAQISKSDSPDYARVSTALLGFSEALKPLHFVPVVGIVEAALQSAASVARSAADLQKLDISNARKCVQEALDRVGKPVVVFVDDVDRLPPTEIRLLFQFLKAVADFRGVSYVIAYDPAPVEHALSFDGRLDGREYLKKFIQVPIRLPRLSRLLMRKFVNHCVINLQQGATCALLVDELRALSECATSDLVLDCLKTPRDVVRCFNLLKLRLPDFHREVHLSDLLKFTILDLLSPETIDFVRRNSGAFVGLLLPHPEFSRNERSLVGRISSNGLIDENARDVFSNTLEESVRNLLDSLFPKTPAPGPHIRSTRNAHGLTKLLFGGSTPMAFSIAEAEAVLQNQSRHESIQEKVSAGVFREWVYFLESITGDARISESGDLASELIEAGNQAAAISDSAPQKIRSVLAHYLVEVLAQLKDQDEAILFVEEIISHWENLQISHSVLLSLAIDAGLWENGRSVSIKDAPTSPDRRFCIPAENVLALEKQWRGLVQMQAENGSLHKQSDLSSLLHSWGQFPNNDYAEPQKYIQRFSEQDDPLPLLLQSGDRLDIGLLEMIPSAHQAILSGLSRHNSQSDLREMAANMIRQLQARTASLPVLPISRGEFGPRD